MLLGIRTVTATTMASAALLLATPAFAQEASSEPSAVDEAKVVDTIDDATLRAVIAKIGATAAPLDDEENTLRIAYPNGMRGIARRMACEGEQGCKGLILLGYFSRPTDIPAERAAAAPLVFGLEQNLASVVINREGEHVVKSYIIFDGGITVANLAVQVALFGESVKAYQQVLYGTDG